MLFAEEIGQGKIKRLPSQYKLNHFMKIQQIYPIQSWKHFSDNIMQNVSIPVVIFGLVGCKEIFRSTLNHIR